VSTISSTKTSGAKQCKDRNADIPVGQKVPWGEPLKGKPRITSPYGPRRLEGKNSFHDGIDYGVSIGTAVYVPAEGKVARVINDSRCGKGLRIRHGDGTQTIYCHLSKQLVTEGASVGAGCKIAESGNTGHSTGPHLHYGIRNSSGDKINPAAYTKRAK
jgi:murein DD-endopeptidase MepM/ murein hydrolase activator NlpD